MLSKPIPLLDFSPDADPRTPGLFLDMDGFIGTTKGLKTLPAAVAIGDPLLGFSRGTYAAELSSGFVIVVAGTSDHLYRRDGMHWTQFDGGQTFHGGTNRWSFTTFGMYIIAVNGVDPPQISRSNQPFQSIASLVAADQAPPISHIVETTDYSIFLIPTDQSKFAWYASSSPLVGWKPDVATLTAAAPLTATPGRVTSAHRLRGGIVIFKNRGLYFGQFQGPPFVYAFISISDTVGAPSQDSVVSDGDVLYLRGPDNFYRFDGSSLTPIPNNLKEWFQANADPEQLSHMLGRYDPVERIVYWHFASLERRFVGQLDLWLAFSTRSQKWTKGSGVLDENGRRDFVIDVLLPGTTLRTPGLTYARFDAQFGTYPSPTNDTMHDFVYGDPSFDGTTTGAAAAVVGSDNVLRTFTGLSPGGMLRTGEISDPPYVLLLSQVRPVFSAWPERPTDPDTATRSTPQAFLDAVRQRSSGEPIPDDRPFKFPTGEFPPANFDRPPHGLSRGITPRAFLSQDGAFNFLQTARMHQLMMSFTAFTEITAVQYDLTRMGTQ